MAIENLATARVLVVDDQPNEALPILTALGRIGVGCVYIKGDILEDLPKSPISGIRLVFLDMRLDDGGDQKTALSKTVSVLQKCVRVNTMPLVVVCWTKHDDDVELFQKMAVGSIPGLEPGFIVRMPKPLTSDPTKWKGTLERIRQTLKPYDAVGLLWHWENLLHDAITETSQVLADMSAEIASSSESTTSWQDAIFRIYRELVRADAGQTAVKKTAPYALLRTLNELAVDRIQHLNRSKPLPCADKLIPGAQKPISGSHRAQLNQRLLLDLVDNDLSCAPGTILISRPSFSRPFARLIAIHTGQQMDEYLAGFLEEGACKKAIEGQWAKAGSKKVCASPLRDLFRFGRMVMIEVSPPCDFAQARRPTTRFLAGLAIPESFSKCRKKAEHLFTLPPMTIPSLSEAWSLAFSSRYLITGADINSLHIPRAKCRLRSHVLTDLRMWAAFRHARPGILSIQ